MNQARNPFRLRAAEQIESDANFLRLFGPGMLDLLPNQNLLGKLHIFQGAPGGGKTSLFRIFTPSALHTLYEFRALEAYQEVYNRLKRLDVVSDEAGPKLLGVMLSCARNYAMLEDISDDVIFKERLLYALLNARLTLATLRSALALKKCQFPADLNYLTFTSPTLGDLPARIPIPSSGKDLYEWAKSVEKNVHEKLDSFGAAHFDSLEGHETLEALSLIRPECILFEGTPVADQVLVMLDDTHKLTLSQRRSLQKSIYDLRSSVGVWIAERLEALNLEELSLHGVSAGRDYEVIRIEDCWRKSKRFETLIVNIADRRVRLAYEAPIGSFAEGLRDSLDDLQWQPKFDKAVHTISERVRGIAGLSTRYQEWVDYAEKTTGTARERAIAWRTVEVMIERDRRKVHQLAFDFLPLPTSEFEDKRNSAVRAAAELLIAQEFDLPYYFGISKLATLASLNIEQFLALAGELFEEVISAALIKRQAFLSPKRQEEILRKVCRRWWSEIPRRASRGRDVQNLLDGIGQDAQQKWHKGTASYGGGGGVTGIGIPMSDWEKLLHNETLLTSATYERLLACLSSAMSHNLLEARPDTPQGKKGRLWMILYLNRWLCLNYNLPLQYGGWRQVTIDQLEKWISNNSPLLVTRNGIAS